jgi:hypothetical protein
MTFRLRRGRGSIQLFSREPGVGSPLPIGALKGEVNNLYVAPRVLFFEMFDDKAFIRNA